MSFAAPLGVGLESMGEYLDIEVNTMTTEEEMKTALNQTMAEGLRIISVKQLPETAKNAMAGVAAAKYQITCLSGDGSPKEFPVEDLKMALRAFLEKERIPVIKKTKKGERELDLKPGIWELKAEEAIPPFDPDGRRYPAITMLVDASSGGNIKPALVWDAFLTDCGITPESCSYQITRIETYGNTAPEGKTPEFVPLSEIY